MNVVGRVGSLISQGVYSVATPFHPFGGAVDIIAVAQEDGTYRSTPWYVCFGKFQGVLKGTEKMVTISVNGIQADFHMYLDNSGRAYFMKEVASGGEELESCDPSVSGSRRVDNIDDEIICSENKGDHENGDFSFGIGDGQSSPGSTSGYGAYQYGSLNEVEDLVKSSDESNSEMVLISVDGHVLTAPISANGENTDSAQLSSTPQFHLGPGEGSGEEFGASGDVWEVGCFSDVDESMQKDVNAPHHRLEGLKDGGDIKVQCQEGSDTVSVNKSSSSENVGTHMSKDDLFKSCLDFTVHIDDAGSNDTNSLHTEVGQKDESNSPLSTIAVEEEGERRVNSSFTNDELHHVNNITKDLEISTYDSSTCEPDQIVNAVGLCNSDQPSNEILPSNNTVTEASEETPLNIENITKIAYGGSVTNDLEDTGTVPGRSPTVEDCSHIETQKLQGRISGMGIEISLSGNLIHPGMGRASAEETFDAHRISEMEFKESGPSIIKNGNLIARFEERYFSWDKAAHIIVGKAVFGSHFSFELNDSIPVEHEETPKARGDTNIISPSFSGRWRLWSIPFRRSRSLQHSNSNSSNEELFVDSESFLLSPNAGQTLNNISRSPRKQYLRTNIPTTEQIASLNLKEGQNKIAFSFSTRVLGKQEVDAHIYLWKWNARIVISDVDGTITKSDVLGQFMPLVGKDWTQSGVAHLFSAIKENGYQLLFLSARAIVQAYLTRSFLLNLKQDGKALPSGPVVISPDGLFPSLYREVIRRAPHEFKIACLEDIRALFPSDYNPFYAGFGNRDTDELSYKKIGIPKGKIFIINPKGEVAINHCIDVKSYTSLHTLVNDMFPPTSLVEQEDFNSWNYWKTPLPNIEC